MNLINELHKMKSLMGIISENEIINDDVLYTGKPFCGNAFSKNEHKKICYSFQDVLNPSVKRGKGGKNLRVFINNILNTYEQNVDDSEVKYINFKNDLTDFHTKRIEELDMFITTLDSGCSKLKDKLITKRSEIIDNGIEGIIWYDEKEPQYSHFNRLNTNYSALAILLTKYVIDNYLTDNNSIIDFTDRSQISTFIEEKFKTDQGRDFIKNLVYNQQDQKMSKIRNSILYTIGTTRKRGNKAENEFADLLTKKNISFVRTLDDFSIVDMVGIDMVVKFPNSNNYIPVQVKSSRIPFPQLLKNICENTCNGLFVFKDKDEFKYISCNDNIVKDIEDLF